MSQEQNRFSQFTDIITSFDQVRNIMGDVHQSIEAKVIDRLDDICISYIEASPFVVMASAGESHIEVSPKGDPNGFVKVLDEKHLAIPERPGNRRADSYKNILENPQLGLIFLIPGKMETLRISGEARIVRDLALRESMAINGRVPEFALVLYVVRALVHCPKCIVRSNLWQAEKWQGHSHLANINETYIQHARLSMSEEEFDRLAEEKGWKTLY